MSRPAPLSIVLLALAMASTACQTTANRENEPRIAIARSAFDGSKLAYKAHPNYVSLELPFEPMKPAFDQLNAIAGVGPLINRGEAHVTLLTPPEFDAIKALVSMPEIDAIANRRHVQAAAITPVCIGEGRLKENLVSRTYFAVVRSPDLVEFRRAVAKSFIQRGGDPAAFDPDHFFSHVTIGFDKTDLYEEQGVIKDDKSCRFAIELAH